MAWKASNPFDSTKDLRAASHAGDWYTDQDQELNAQLAKWLDDVGPADSYPIKGCKAVIAPHAGYAYSGPAAAWAYRSIDITGIKRVFVLGPSHHVYLQGCALSRCKEYDTPIGTLPLDLETIEQLQATGKFEMMSIGVDEDEHSIEMHLPYVRKIFEGRKITIVPIMVGAISLDLEASYGAILAPYLEQEDTICIVSSDFCHWGTRFSYTYYYPEAAPTDVPALHLSRSLHPSSSHPIHQSIKQLDYEAMNILAQPGLSAAEIHTSFANYLNRTKNTICGRHPIGVLFGVMTHLEKGRNVKHTLEWVRYEQSSACLTVKDSSVSYASAWVRFQ